ncbi:MAG: hypothetical protein NTV80_09035, partial [Verrucomicrobia bacterium]|nr:hypothetical protein [Verrucomicrobiota bacterium]
MMRSRLQLLLFVAALFCAASASAQNTINSVSLPSYVVPGYVIGADAVDGVGATNRHVIDTSCQITINTPGAYAIQWSLVAPDNSVMITSTSTAGTITPPMVPDTRTVNGGLIPTAALPLQVGVLYRLHVQLVNTGTSAIADTRTQPTGFTYIHLKGTDPASTALNVVSEITSVVINRDFLLETNPALTTIPVTVSYRLHRYDNWDAANDPKPVVVNLDSTALRLHSDGSLKPSTITNGIFPVPGVNSFTGAGPRMPATVTGTRIIQVDPTSILPPQTYRIETQITHTEQSPSTVFTGNVFPSVATSLAHFTGQLNFGSIITHF